MYRQEKEEILKTARKLMAYGIVKLSAGNLSIRQGDHVIEPPPRGWTTRAWTAATWSLWTWRGRSSRAKRMPSLDTVGLLYIYNHIPRIRC